MKLLKANLFLFLYSKFNFLNFKVLLTCLMLPTLFYSIFPIEYDFALLSIIFNLDKDLFLFFLYHFGPLILLEFHFLTPIFFFLFVMKNALFLIKNMLLFIILTFFNNLLNLYFQYYQLFQANNFLFFQIF